MLLSKKASKAIHDLTHGTQEAIERCITSAYSNHFGIHIKHGVYYDKHFEVLKNELVMHVGFRKPVTTRDTEVYNHLKWKIREVFNDNPMEVEARVMGYLFSVEGCIDQELVDELYDAVNVDRVRIAFHGAEGDYITGYHYDDDSGTSTDYSKEQEHILSMITKHSTTTT